MKIAFRALLVVLLLASVSRAQVTTAKVSPEDYEPTAGSGLTLNIGAGTAYCGTAVSYAGGTLSMTGSTTNYVFLDPTASCAPGKNTTGFPSSSRPIAVVVAGSSSITSVTDVRGMPSPQGLVAAIPCSFPKYIQSISVTGQGTCSTPGGTGGALPNPAIRRWAFGMTAGS